jgi:hypothetical protein
MSSTTWVSGLASPFGCVTDGTYLYITDLINDGGYSVSITRILLSDNTDKNNYVIYGGNPFVGPLAIDSNYLYASSIQNGNQPIITLIVLSTMSTNSTTLSFYQDFDGNYPSEVSGLLVVGDYLYCSHGTTGVITRFYIPSITIGQSDNFNQGDFGGNSYGWGYLGNSLSNPIGLATDNTYLYIASYGNNNIVTMPLTGDGTSGSVFKSGVTSVYGLSVSGDLYSLYTVGSNNTFTQIEISSTNQTTLLSSGLFNPHALTSSGGYFYITNYASGGTAEPNLNDGYILQYGTASPSSDTSLTVFDINSVSVGTSGGGTVFLLYGTTSTTVDVTTTSSAASITVNGGDPSIGSISTSATGLVTGSNTVTVYVLAEDGTTNNTYYGYITVEDPSSNTSLTTFTVNDTPVTDGETIYVSYGITSVPVVVVTTSSAAYISVDLNEELPSTGTGSVTNTFSGLSVGSNTLNVNVLAQDGVTSQIYTVTINRNGAPTVPCFGENTKILCFNREKSLEEYVLIQDIRKGTLVKTLLNGYLPVDMIGKSTIHNHDNNERIKNRLYKCTKENYPELVYDELILTGCHSILVGELTHEQREKTMKELEKIYITDKNYRLLTFLDSRAETYQVEGEFPIYHLALENENYYMNYGIFANGLLVESCSKRYIKELSGMTLIE